MTGKKINNRKRLGARNISEKKAKKMRLLGRIKDNFLGRTLMSRPQLGGKHLSCGYSIDKPDTLECGKSTRDILSHSESTLKAPKKTILRIITATKFMTS